MTINQLVVLGSSSSIARILLPSIKVDCNQIFTFDRVSSNQSRIDWIPRENQFRIDWNNAERIKNEIGVKLSNCLTGPVLILNFMGLFGRIERIENLDIEEALSVISANILPFLLAAKISISMPPLTRVISFSGAGVGGDNLDDSSIGYLAAKASMGLLTEAIDRQLSSCGIRFGLISPGPFPSRMQEAVAKDLTQTIPEARKIRAQEVMRSKPSTERLSNLVHFLAANPDELGGRIWSASFDELKSQVGNFGKLRRVY